MRRRLGPWAQALFLPVVGVAIALVVVPGQARLAIHVFVLVVVGIALAFAVRAIAAVGSDATPSPFETALRPRVAAVGRLPELERLEREVGLAGDSAFDVHFRLRPVLRELAAGLLFSRRGVDLDRRPDRARELIGAELWELVRPDRSPPSDRHAPGIGADELERAVSALEEL